MMIAVRWFLIFFAIISGITTSGTKLETLKKCCNLGTNYANSGLKCITFQPPIAGISQEDEAFCLNSIDVCCKKKYREIQCEAGQKLAQSGKDCDSSNDDADGEFLKDCCETCQLGLETGMSGQSCQSDLGLGSLMDLSFETCCKKTLTTTSTTTSTSPSVTTSRLPISSSFTKSLEKFDEKNSPPPPTLEALCDIPDLCAHICLPTGDSYKCECYPGFTLMADGISCKPSKRSSTNLQRCGLNNPCHQVCTDTGFAIKCSCYEGFELDNDKRTCKDIDECVLGIHDCEIDETCINLEGDYECQEIEDDSSMDKNFIDKCPMGYKFNADQMVCDDIDECEIGLVCLSGTCVNTIGSFKCEEMDTPQCPPGFIFKKSIETCDDIDECITGKDDCNRESQICLNTKGNYTCIDKASKKTCPPGFKKNVYTQLCEDIDECEENVDLCAEDEECVNEPGGHNCIPKLETTPSIVLSSSDSVPKIIESTQPILVSATTSSSITYPTTTQSVVQTSKWTTSTNQNTQSIKPAISFRPQTPLLFINNSNTNHIQPQYSPKPIFQTKPTFSPYQPVNQRVVCSSGYKFSEETSTCTDINECTDIEQICDSTQDCYNTVGSYICNCKNGYTKEYQTGACVDVNECQIGQHDCSEGQRCDNTIGSYLCSRTTGCGTGYTLNSATGLCEDDDECVLGLHNCHDLGTKFQCRNTLGSYRCEIIKCTGDCLGKKVYTTTTKITQPSVDPTRNYPVISGQQKRCLPGYKMNLKGECEDINECSSNPCKRGEKCLNLNGRYQCIPYIQCKSGYEINEAGTGCVDVNECARGTHKCKNSQICKNGPGYYICQCPPGHKLNINNECEDINECEFYRERICSVNAFCVNTVGSYKCKCKEGFRESGNGCSDVDECVETVGLCHQNCINLWGSYRCSCERGFTLNSDNRTCTDINECEKFSDKYLCVGTCQNTPGSYTCKCPEGYRLGADGRTCQDIDECRRSVCRSQDDVCFNTRGSYKCHRIICPPNYIRDPEHKSRCKRASNVCDIRDISCIRMPEQYQYHLVTFVSNLPIPEEGRIDFFQMKGPNWTNSTITFNMDLLNVRCPRMIRQADERYFRMKRDINKIVISLTKSIEGPQEIELQLQMELYVNGAFQGKVVSTVYIYVSEYEF